MSSRRPRPSGPQCHQSRRSFLADTGMGFTGLALGAMLGRDQAATAADAPAAHPQPLGPGLGAVRKPKAKEHSK